MNRKVLVAWELNNCALTGDNKRSGGRVIFYIFFQVNSITSAGSSKLEKIKKNKVVKHDSIGEMQLISNEIKWTLSAKSVLNLRCLIDLYVQVHICN